MPILQTRRRFLTTLSLAGAAALVHAPPALAAEGPPEITSVHFVKIPGDCLAPQDLAEELLRDEGFTDIPYVDKPSIRSRRHSCSRGPRSAGHGLLRRATTSPSAAHHDHRRRDAAADTMRNLGQFRSRFRDQPEVR